MTASTVGLLEGRSSMNKNNFKTLDKVLLKSQQVK